MKTNKKPTLTVKTNMKAGSHCKDAFDSWMKDPYNNGKADKFINCCRSDDKCLR